VKILANENFPKASVEFLRNEGYDIVSIAEKFGGIKDEEVIALAITEERIILTFDRDYGELVFKKGLKPSKGIIYFRLDEFLPIEPGSMIHSLIASNKFNFQNTLTVVDKSFIRQRSY
jgi:predicted nuclease of predicted toxin-antitoxin system